MYNIRFVHCYFLQKAIQTGNDEFDQLVRVICASGMIVGAAIACFLDNTIPGTKKERGY